jgi:hypothetical protein
MELASRPRRLLFYAGGVICNLLAAVVLLGLHFVFPPLAPSPVTELATDPARWERAGDDFQDRMEDPGGGLETLGQHITENGWRGALFPLALLNIVLAIFNLVPIPPLDGYRCLLVLIGLVMRRDVPRKVLLPLNLLGCFILLLMLVLNGFVLIGEFVWVLVRKSP